LDAVICVTGAEKQLAAVARRIEAEPDCMHELRLDHLAGPVEGLRSLIAAHGDRLVVCARAERQGGAFVGSERERGQLLIDAASAGARYVDLEADVDDALLEAVGRERAVLSWHDFDGVPEDAPARLRAMVERNPAVVKVAFAVTDAAELVKLMTLRPAIPQRAVLIGMGAAGLLSRTHYARFGSAWTYVAADASLATAPGQLDLATARRHGLPASASAPFCGLVGGEQVMRSPGAWIYGGLFRELGIDWSYVPVVTQSLREVLPLLEALDARGLSVTMPHKQAAFDRSEPDETSAQLGAVNSLKRQGERWLGRNSDVAGVREPLRSRCRAGERALILGAGGAARAAVYACRALGLEVTVAARRPERAQGIERVVAWQERGKHVGQVLVNATPVVGKASPWPSEGPWPAVVFELALGAPSRLLRDATAAGSIAIDALAMWLHQGAEQMSWFLDRPITPDDLRRQR
jgi:3-dehydroquinate dehydratase / shikimate dehydrogenase